MKSQLFPLLDKSHVDRLLRGGLTIEPSETALLHAARRMNRLDILSLNEMQTVRCVNLGDEDYPDDVTDESCEGVIRLVAQRQNVQHNNAPANDYAIYRCPSCGRVIEYPGLPKQIFPKWETALNQTGIAEYLHSALYALGASAMRNSSGQELLAPTGVLLSNLLTQQRSWLVQHVNKSITQHPTSPTSPVRHRRRTDLQVLRNSLVDAFPTKQILAQMLRLQLNLNLEVIALGENLVEIVDKVIARAESEGWLPDLVEAARRENSGNPNLQQLSVDGL